MTDHHGTIGIMTLLVASMASILPLLNEGQGLPSVDFSTVTIQFHKEKLQLFYDCLCEDNMEECTMHYFNIFVRNVVSRLKQDMLFPIPREVTFGCDRPFDSVGGARKYSCFIQQADNTSVCGCAANCPMSHIHEKHSTKCKDKCVNIMWNSCSVQYEDFVNDDAPVLNSCPQPTPPSLPPSATPETDETTSTTNEYPSSINGTALSTNRYTSLTNGYSSSNNGYASSTNGIHETTTIGDHDSEGTNDIQTLIIAVGASGGAFLILVLSVIIAVCCCRRRKRKSSQTKELKSDRENDQYETNDYFTLETDTSPHHSPIQNSDNIDNHDNNHSGQYENERKMNTCMHSEGIDDTTETSKDNNNVKLAKIDNIITHCRDPVYHGSYEDVDLDELGPRLHNPKSESAGQICLKQNSNKENGGLMNINMLKAYYTKPDQNKNMDEFVLVTDNFASQLLPGFNAKDGKHKQTAESNADDIYAKVVKIKKSKRGNLAKYKPELPSFSADKDGVTDTYARLGQREELDDGELATYNHESQTFSKIHDGKKEVEDKDGVTDTYARLGQRKDINAAGLATYNHDSQTFSKIHDGKKEVEDKDGVTDTYARLGQREEIDDGDLATYNHESQTFSKLQDGKKEVEDKDGVTDTYARLGQRADIDGRDLATYNHESQTFCNLQNGKNEGNELTDNYINLGETEVMDDGDLGTCNKESQTFC
ncbi:hypothetical protein PoB_004673800 [Plakobranchus ocellatus]|uniref:Uncharacterized protein n=1 Tax=Plakobranchus ocellatus TaxID=259542 RepID=A0AAV4BN57_9GAST|nr:hypothetical protein PoB_004673800 [Plakobranchus ocellatus]